MKRSSSESKSKSSRRAGPTTSWRHRTGARRGAVDPAGGGAVRGQRRAAERGDVPQVRPARPAAAQRARRAQGQAPRLAGALSGDDRPADRAGPAPDGAGLHDSGHPARVSVRRRRDRRRSSRQLNLVFDGGRAKRGARRQAATKSSRARWARHARRTSCRASCARSNNVWPCVRAWRGRPCSRRAHGSGTRSDEDERARGELGSSLAEERR